MSIDKPLQRAFDVTTTEGQVATLDHNIVRAISTLASSLGVAVQQGRRTCVHCLHFDLQAETCALARQRPPATVIAFGCPSFLDGNVPF